MISANLTWWPGWDSNPQNSDFESDTYANSITRPYNISLVAALQPMPSKSIDVKGKYKA